MVHFPVRRFVPDLSPNFLLSAAVLLVGAALLAGCHPAITDPNDPKFVVAEKGPWKITEAELDTEVAGFLKQHQTTPEQVGPSKMPMVKTMMLKNMVLKKLILDKAAASPPKDADKDEAGELAQIKGPMAEPEFEEKLKTAGVTLDDLKKQIHEKVLIQDVLKAEALNNVQPTDQEIDAIYLKNKDKFNIPAKVRASRILILVDDKTSPADKVARKKAIDKARDRVIHGEDFSKVAMEVSQDRYSAPKGGDIDFFQRGVNEPGFDDVAFNTKPNAISPVFLTQLGYQFIKVTAIQPAGVVPVADARGYISSKLREMKMQQQSQAYAQKLLADSGVTYHLVLVDPPAQNAPAAGPGGPDNAPPPAPPDTSAPAPPPSAPDASAAPAPPLQPPAPATNSAPTK